MPSPFPGMDPYIESWIWRDFHLTMIVALRAQLSTQLPRRYFARIDSHYWWEDKSEEDRLLFDRPTARVKNQAEEWTEEKSPVATVAAPITTQLPGVPKSHRYLCIVDSEERRLASVIMLLTPQTKGVYNGGEAYRYKREEHIGGGINLVEIDLFRSGFRPPLGDPAPPVTDYYVLVSRTQERPVMNIWPISVRDALPLVPVPFDPSEPEAVLDLRIALDRTYDEGRYADLLDYTKPPAVPLREPDATWARELVAARFKN